MKSLAAILDKYSFQKRSGKRQINITDIEAAFNFEFPQDYKYYLLNYKGYDDFIEKEYVVLWNEDELIRFNKAMSIQEYLPRCFAIGGNGSGELIVLESIRLGAIRVVLAPTICISPEDFVEIGSSFTDFLIRLETGRSWFD
jgi:hypothetical protein